MRPLILDGFCGAGLVYDGLYAAGWQPVGVDIAPMPSYPGPFIQADALAMDDRFYRMFEGLWFSPPCLKDTELYGSARREQEAHGVEVTDHPDLITPTQKLVDRLGMPYVIENVRNTKLLRQPVTLCGSMFGLGAEDSGRRVYLERHRKFETNWGLTAPSACNHLKPCVGVYGGHARIRAASLGGRGSKEPWSRPGVDIMHEAMGLDRRLSCDEISQGIPPAYSEYVGRQLQNYLGKGDLEKCPAHQIASA